MRTKFSCFYIFQQIKIITFVQRQSVQMQPLSKISDPQTMRGTRWQGREGWLAGSRRAWGGAEQVGVTSIQTPGNSGLASESPNYPTCWDDHRRIFGKQPLSKPKQTTMKMTVSMRYNFVPTGVAKKKGRLLVNVEKLEPLEIVGGYGQMR